MKQTFSVFEKQGNKNKARSWKGMNNLISYTNKLSEKRASSLDVVNGIGQFEVSFRARMPFETAPLISDYAPNAVTFINQLLPHCSFVLFHLHQLILKTPIQQRCV